MKRLLVTALAFTAMASAAVAQEAAQTTAAAKPQTLPLVDKSWTGVKTPFVVPKMSSVESEYLWNSVILRRYGQGGDTNRRDLTVPLQFAGNAPVTVMRGFGQIFAPRSLYSVYNGSVYNENTSYVSNVDERFESDQQYIDQFKGAGKFTLSAVSFPFYHNPRNTPLNPGLVSFLKSTVNFGGSTFRQNGLVNVSRSLLPVARTIELDQNALDTTTYSSDQPPFDTLISYTVFEFTGEPGEENAPIQFAANESLILLYTNEFAPGVTQPIEANDTREWQRVIASEEYRTGSVREDENNPGEFIDDRANPLDSSKVFGVVMFRTEEKDSIYSTWQGLVFGEGASQRRAYMNLNTTFAGTVELAAGVDFHFGKDANAQGIGSVSPNPVREKAVIPFSLTERSNVKMDLYDVTGKFIRTLVDVKGYIPGNYSVNLTTDDLINGVYLLRMTTGEKVYTSKLNISK